MKLSVDSEARVIPSSSGSAVAGSPPSAITRAFSSRNLILSTFSPSRKLVSPGLVDQDLLKHLPDDHLDMLVVDLHALQTVDFLDLVHQVRLHLVDTQIFRISCGSTEPSHSRSPACTWSPS